MSELILDDFILEKNSGGELKYGGFWPRTGALILDSLILSPVSILLFANMIYWKSMGLFIIFSLSSMIYKPYMEYIYGATLGKKMTNLTIVDVNNQKLTLQKILLRNIFNIISGIMALIFVSLVFSNQEFQNVTSFMEYSTFINGYGFTKALNAFLFLTYLIDGIYLLFDKKKRALHDRIGGTLVIKHYSSSGSRSS